MTTTTPFQNEPATEKPAWRAQWERFSEAREQLRKDIYADVFDAFRMMPGQKDSLGSQSERLVKKVMHHVQAWALMDKVCSEETRREIAKIVANPQNDDGWEVIDNPPLEMVIQDGDMWRTDDSTEAWQPMPKGLVGETVRRAFAVPSSAQIRRRKELPADFGCIPEPYPLPKRTDSAGRDVTDLPGLWDESDTITEQHAAAIGDYLATHPTPAPEQPLQAGEWVVRTAGSVDQLLKGFVYQIADVALFSIKLIGFDGWYVKHNFRRARPDEIPQPPKLQLRDGAWYRRRDGEVVGPCKPRRYGNYPWCVGGNWYKHDGQWHTAYSGLDLIAEVPPPQSQQIELEYKFLDNGDMVINRVQSQPDADGWIPWNGGEMPVASQQLVDLRFRRATDMCPDQECYRETASEWDWTHGNSDSDIVAYRIVQPAQYRPFASAEEFRPHRDRWLRYKHKADGVVGRSSWVTIQGVEIGKHALGWTTLFHDYVFDDNGQPCGIEASE